MPQVNIGGVGQSRMEELTQQEAVSYWSTGKVPDRFGVKQLANGKRVTNEYEAYWASQPAEIQPLMYANTEALRQKMGHEYADAGFIIDVPIMVWGWDPLSTMIVRKNQGYTWVPSANMPPVAVQPGITFPGLPTYDPKVIPAGGIPVTTKWAEGFLQTSPWPIDPEDLKIF